MFAKITHTQLNVMPKDPFLETQMTFASREYMTRLRINEFLLKIICLKQY